MRFLRNLISPSLRWFWKFGVQEMTADALRSLGIDWESFWSPLAVAPRRPRFYAAGL